MASTLLDKKYTIYCDTELPRIDRRQTQNDTGDETERLVGDNQLVMMIATFHNEPSDYLNKLLISFS